MIGYVSPRPLLLAEQAHTAIQPGDCPLCPHQLRTGQRIARLLDGSGWAYAWCAATIAPGRRLLAADSTPARPA